MRLLPRDSRVLALALLSWTIPALSGCQAHSDGPGQERSGEQGAADLSMSTPDQRPPTSSTVSSPAEQVEPLSQDDLEVMTASELVERASQVIALDEKLRILEAALKKEPEDHRILFLVMQTNENKGIELALQPGRREESKPYLYRAAEVARQLLEQGDPLDDQVRRTASIVLYNEACNLTIDEEPDQAIESLREAIRLGFNDPIIHSDEELDPLRERDDFQELASSVPDAQPISESR